MELELTKLTKEDLKDIQKGLNDMFSGYVQSLHDIIKIDRDNVVFSYNQLSELINKGLNEFDK